MLLPTKYWQTDIPEAKTVRYILMAGMAMHVVFGVLFILQITYIINALWEGLAIYVAFWGYMTMSRCPLYVYVILLGWTTISTAISIFLLKDFFLKVAHALCNAALCYFMFTSINKFSIAYDNFDPNKVVEKVKRQSADIESKGDVIDKVNKKAAKLEEAAAKEAGKEIGKRVGDEIAKGLKGGK